MAKKRKEYGVGEAPPLVVWTVVRGDTSAFKVYVTDDAKQPLNIPDWQLQAEVRRPTTPGVFNKSLPLILTLTTEQDENDLPGEFTVSLSSEDSELLETGDVFDIEISLPQDSIVWTVAQGSIQMFEDVTA